MLIVIMSSYSTAIHYKKTIYSHKKDAYETYINYNNTINIINIKFYYLQEHSLDNNHQHKTSHILTKPPIIINARIKILKWAHCSCMP